MAVTEDRVIDLREVEAVPGGQARALWLLSTALVLSMTTWFSATAVIPQLRVELSISDGVAAWLTIAVQLGFVAGALISSITTLTDVMPVRLVLIASSLLAALANLGLLQAESAGALIAFRFATGFFLAGVYPPAVKLLSTWFRARRGTALGILVGALTLGTAAPHLVNALGGLDWKLVIKVTSLSTAIGAAFVLLFVSEGPFPYPRATFDLRQFGRVFRNRGVLLASIGYFGHMWELYAMWAWFVVFARASFVAAGRGEGESAALVTFFVIGIGAVGCWLGGLVGDRWSRPRSTSLMMIVSGSCSVVIGFAYGGPPALVVALGLVWGLTVVGDSAQFSALVTEYADPRYVGTALTLQLALGFTLTVVTIWLLPWMERAVTWRWAFAILALGPVVGTLAMRRLARLTTA